VKHGLGRAVARLAFSFVAMPATAHQMDMSHAQTAKSAKKAKPKTAASNAAPINEKSSGAAAVQRAGTGVRSPAPATDAPSMPEMKMPVASETAQPPTRATDSRSRSAVMGMAMAHPQHIGSSADMTGALGPYAAERESSGTAWQPDTSEDMGLHAIGGEWMLMAHGVLVLVYDHQSGPRGDDKAFASGMLMGMARRTVGNGTVQFRAMLSPDPLMGPRGYPLLLAAGETANGRDRLIDRQHPHDFVMELSASLSENIGEQASLFLYAGLPGEPAFGPPAFMHREAIMDSPEAPITHHWLDSTHISFGVLTAGFVLDRVKLEASRFNGREPDQHRWGIETAPLDSTSVRLSWNPVRTLALQASWGHFIDPEQLEPGADQTRWSASALMATNVRPGWKLAGTLAWGRKSSGGHNDDAVALEASLKHKRWTVFARSEMTENREISRFEQEPAYRVGKISIGTVRDFQIMDHCSIGIGGQFALNFLPDALEPIYGGDHPLGAIGFVRFRLD
jgi:hypothetical protein